MKAKWTITQAFLPMVVFLSMGAGGAAAPANNAPQAIDAALPILDFVSAHGTLERAAWPADTPPRNTMLAIPAVYIYSPQGETLYSGGSDTVPNIKKNLSVLQEFPLSLKNLSPIKNLPTLRSMLEIVPEFKAKSDRILSDGHYVIYIVTTNEPVTHTEQELLKIRAVSSNTAVDTLLVRVHR